MPYLDVDRRIEEDIAGETLTEYWLRIGDAAFRKHEARVVLDLCARDHAVVAFGAGTLKFAASREAATHDALVIYLQVPIPELWRRFQSDPLTTSTRPNLAGGGIEEIEQLMADREPVYLECASLVIDGTRPPQELAAKVVATFTTLSDTRET